MTSIGSEAFRYCTGLTSINILEGVTSIGDYAFYNCSSLTSITIPNSVTSIGERIFGHCSSLTSITIGNGVTSIGACTFLSCSSLTSITIPNSMHSISNNAFDSCKGLTAITIPNSVWFIGRRAFMNCSSLTSITILGQSSLSIGYQAFYNCKSLKDVYCFKENVSATNNDEFYSSNIEFATLHVPAASVNAYSTAAPWNAFSTIAPIYDEESSKSFPSCTYAKADLKRTFAEGLNTICLPFVIDDIEATFGTGTEAYGFDDFADGKLKFSQVTSLTAGTPYVIYVPAEITELISFENIVVEESNTTSSSIEKNGVYFCGTYTPLATGKFATYEWTKNNSTDDIYVLTADGAMGKAGDGAGILGFCGYFAIPAGTEVNGFVLNGGTGIKAIDNGQQTMDNRIYNVAGQRMSMMQKGINIIGGHKVLK